MSLLSNDYRTNFMQIVKYFCARETSLKEFRPSRPTTTADWSMQTMVLHGVDESRAQI